jgi:ubiquinone/menaquinone biosynthesis C-methylase UbiE
VQADRLGLAARRTQLVAGLSGRVLEVGAGNGLNFRHYPASVDELVAVETERHLRALAHTADRAAVPVTVIDALAERLPFPDGSFDAAVASLTLCSIGDVERALAELHRVVRPSGELRFFEHVASPRRAARAFQRAADATIWPHLSGGCHLSRDTGALIEAAGFAIERCERFSFRIPPFDPPKTHIIGVARRAGDGRRAPGRA